MVGSCQTIQTIQTFRTCQTRQNKKGLVAASPEMRILCRATRTDNLCYKFSISKKNPAEFGKILTPGDDVIKRFALMWAIDGLVIPNGC